MTKSQNVIITFYGLFASISGAFLFHHWSAFLFIGFTLAFVQKMVNSIMFQKTIPDEAVPLTAVHHIRG